MSVPAGGTVELTRTTGHLLRGETAPYVAAHGTVPLVLDSRASPPLDWPSTC
jgi:hypothetical protein